MHLTVATAVYKCYHRLQCRGQSATVPEEMKTSAAHASTAGGEPLFLPLPRILFL